jgi:hypothetical protein
MSSPTTNPTPAQVLAAFRDLGLDPIPLWEIPLVQLRNLTARGLHLSGHISSPADQTEFNTIEQELANRVMGRAPLLK